MKTDKLREMSLLRKKSHATMLKKKSKVYEAFLKMEEVTYCAGELESKIKELIAIGISVVINCESCMQWHIEQAARKGATEKEIMEAIEVGIEMGGGPATAHARFALEVLETLDFSKKEIKRHP
ncbi:MAG: carboxymuconolactone decarboxylase family protein [Deltaproteobacteria bacterium]|nr:carboxymuconolactone decarboxylase family protein [Deltaproteobacteria bacterium]